MPIRPPNVNKLQINHGTPIFFKGPLKRLVLLLIPTNMTVLNLKTFVKQITKINPRQGA